MTQIMRLLEFSLQCWSEPWPGTLSAGWPDTEDSVQRSDGNKNEEREWAVMFDFHGRTAVKKGW
jgi:hypothetical protein